MKAKTSKPLKRMAGATPARRAASARAARMVRGDDLGDRRLQLLLATRFPVR